jgi:hypothetical protein
VGQISPSPHYPGILPSIQMFYTTFHNLLIGFSSSILKISAFRPSGSGALLLFNFGIEPLTYSVFGIGISLSFSHLSANVYACNSN